MERLQKVFEIDMPLRAAYLQWTRFEDFPRFMKTVKEVRQLDDNHLHWRASIAGREKEWDARITERVRDRVIAWRSTSGSPNSGRVTFRAAGTGRTRLTLLLEYEPQTVVEKAGDALGLVSGAVDKTVEDFKAYLEGHGRSDVGAARSRES